MDKIAQLIEQGNKKDEIGTLIQGLMDGRDYSNATRFVPTKPAASPNQVGDLTLTNDMPKGKPDVNAPHVVVVDKQNHKTHVLQLSENGQVEDVMTVGNAVGKNPAWTKSGRHEVVNARLDPVWYPPESIGGRPQAPFRPTEKNPKGNPHNPIGVAFIRTSADNGLIGLHGTNRPDSIGKNASHGCIRHNNDDILKIYPYASKPGTPVYIMDKYEGAKIKQSDFLRRN